METTELVEYKLLIPKAKVRKLKSLLEKEGASLERKTKPSKVKRLAHGARKGNYKPGEKPSDFGGLWKDRDITFEEMRKKAWGNRGV